MGLRFQSALQVDNLPDEALTSTFEVVMPTLTIGNLSSSEEGTSLWGSVLSAMGGSTYTPIVEKIRFGVKNFGAATRRVRTGWLNVADDIQNYGEVKITMFCSNGMLTQYYLEAWKDLIFNEEGEYYNSINSYKKNIEVYFFGPGNVGVGDVAVAHYTLVGCFPSQQSPYSLEYSMQPKPLSIDQTFKMDKIIFDQKLIKSSITQELISSPTALLDKAVTALSSDSSAYNINSIY